MAKDKTPKKPKAKKADGRIKQLIRVFKLTIEKDPSALWATLAAVIAPSAVGVILGLWLGAGSPFSIVAWIVTGVLAGVLLGLVVLSRKAEKTAYSQIEGQPGAVGAVLQSALKRGWNGSEVPVAINPKTREAVYRAVGPAGIVLIGEGHRSRVQTLLEDERKKAIRVAPGAPVHLIYVSGDADSVPLAKISSTMLKFKRKLSRAEVTAVSSRLRTLGLKLPIPKGIDPNRMKSQRR